LCGSFFSTPSHSRHATEDHDYIHANWVDGYREPKKFILTQAPLGQTINQFWNMIWQEKCLVVVSMIQMFDINGAEWSIPYIPKKTGEERDAGDIKLIHCGTRCVRRTYDATLIKAIRNGSERRILHLCYFAWGHRGTPRNPTEMLNFVADLNYNRELLVKEAVAAGLLKPNENSPIVAHCITGVARSATLVALDICLKKLDDTANRPCGPLADVEDVVMRIRTQRAMAVQVNMSEKHWSSLSNCKSQQKTTNVYFQKAEMYLFLHLAVFEYAVRQRYISEETYSEVDIGGFFYEPQHQDQEGSGTDSQSTSRTTASSESHDGSKQDQQHEKQPTQKK
ncbi:Protein-tyrosine phosphatase, partial [Ancylostoma duodenale]